MSQTAKSAGEIIDSMKLQKRRKTKFHSVATTVDNITFQSKLEAARYCELKLLLKTGHIFELELQRRFIIVVNGITICRYIADFVYKDKLGHMVVEDAKGYPTPEYRLKAKLMRAVHGITIVEVRG